jgi:hypothetical protein
LTKKKSRETHLWRIDPLVFEPLRKASLFERHILAHARSLGKYTLYSLAFGYPLILVTLGVMFGGLVFWASFAGSMFLIWFVIKKAGYSANFATWDIGYKKFVGLVAAFGIYASLLYALLIIRLIWTVPTFAGILIIALILGVRITSRR